MSERRVLVPELTALGRSERLACDLGGLARSSLRYQPHPPSSAEEDLRVAVQSLAQRHRRYGYRRITALLRRQGYTVKAKRVWRLWKRGGLSLPRKRRPRRHTGPAVTLPQHAERPNHSWTYDVLFDRTASGQMVKILIVLDQIPPDLVVNFQPIDIVDITLEKILCMRLVSPREIKG